MEVAYYRQLRESAHAAWFKLKSLQKNRVDSVSVLKIFHQYLKFIGLNIFEYHIDF